MGEFSIWHWLIVIVIVLLLFGRGKVSDLMGDVAQGIKAFKKGISDDDKADDGKPAPTQADAMKKIDHSDQGSAPKSESVRQPERANT